MELDSNFSPQGLQGSVRPKITYLEQQFLWEGLSPGDMSSSGTPPRTLLTARLAQLSWENVDVLKALLIFLTEQQTF